MNKCWLVRFRQRRGSRLLSNRRSHKRCTYRNIARRLFITVIMMTMITRTGSGSSLGAPDSRWAHGSTADWAGTAGEDSHITAGSEEAGSDGVVHTSTFAIPIMSTTGFGMRALTTAFSGETFPTIAEICGAMRIYETREIAPSGTGQPQDRRLEDREQGAGQGLVGQSVVV
jgi:hypothetical protein